MKLVIPKVMGFQRERIEVDSPSSSEIQRAIEQIDNHEYCGLILIADPKYLSFGGGHDNRITVSYHDRTQPPEKYRLDYLDPEFIDSR